MQLLCHFWGRLASRGILDEELEIELATRLLTSTVSDGTVESILRVVSVFPPQSVPDDLAMALIRHVGKHESVPILLQQHAKVSSIGRRLYAAFCVMQDQPLDDWVDENLRILSVNMREGIEPMNVDACNATIFFWALSHSRKYSQIMEGMNGLLNYLACTEQSKTLACMAGNCPTISIASRLEEIVLNQELNFTTRSEALCGLLPCSQLLQPSDDLLDAVVEMALEGSEYSVDAAQLLCRLFDHGKVPPEKLAPLFETDDATIWMKATSCVAKNASSIEENPLLLNSIAKMATRESARAIRPQVVSLLFLLAKEKSQWIQMARNPHVVETLVKAAPDPKAMEILWNISTPISNRRVLATHIGLLSSWIRFLRALPQNEPRREEWKGRLLDLANLL